MSETTPKTDAPETRTVSLISPYTNQPCDFDLPVNQDEHDLPCPTTKKPFHVLLATVRSKKTRKGGEGFPLLDLINRTFEVRLYLHDKSEKFVRFGTRKDADYEMRARDKVAFIYVNGKVKLVLNLTLGTTLDATKSPGLFG